MSSTWDNVFAEPRWGALSSIRVLDLTVALAGPYCTQLLADHGACVLKVEPPGGDMMRVVPPMFEAANRNKLGVVIDLKSDAGRAALLKLIDGADVLVENFRVGVMDRLGLSYELLSERNPRLVYAAIRGFGDPRTGESPYGDRPCFDVIAQAVGGLTSVIGNETPLPVGIGIGDIFPGTLAAFGILAALHEARQSGNGQFLDVGMVDGMLALCEQLVSQLSATGQTMRGAGTRHVMLSPFGLFRARDGWVALAADQQRAWERLCQIMDRADLMADPRFSTPGARQQNRDALYPTIEEFVARHTRAELDAALGGIVPFGRVQDAADIVADPHYAAREMLIEVDRPGGERPLIVAGVPVKLSRTPGGVHSRAPSLGEHNELLLTLRGEDDQTEELTEHD